MLSTAKCLIKVRNKNKDNTMTWAKQCQQVVECGTPTKGIPINAAVPKEYGIQQNCVAANTGIGPHVMLHAKKGAPTTLK